MPILMVFSEKKSSKLI